MGFAVNNLIGYYYLGNTEYYMFSDKIMNCKEMTSPDIALTP